MIARLQKSRLLSRQLLRLLRRGESPQLTEAIEAVVDDLDQRALGQPLTRLRPALQGLPIGGKRGTDITQSFAELYDDLELLYEALIRLSVRSLDLYDTFAVRRDWLSLQLEKLTLQVETQLAQLAAGSRDSVSDSFHTLDRVDLERTNTYFNLAEGLATLKPDSENSVSYDGTRARVTGVRKPAGLTEHGEAFLSVLNPYRAAAWYATLPPEAEYEVQISVTGADYERGDTEEVVLNALRIVPTGPLRLRIDWSPDGHNWHALEPAVDLELRDQKLLHFAPIQVGYLRFRLRPTGATQNGELPVIGLKQLELLRRGYNLSATLQSQEWRFDQPVHSVVAELETEVPHGTQIRTWVGQHADGPWTPLTGGPVHFGTILDQTAELKVFQTESALRRFFTASIPDRYVLPESGELRAGKDQVELSAYPFDWAVRMEPDHLPGREDWEAPRGIVRSGAFRALGELGAGEAEPDGFVSARSPLCYDVVDTESYGVLAVTEPDGSFVLQPGYNYRLRAYLFSPTPRTLEGQKLGVINPAESGGASTAVVAPHSLYLNGEKVYERTDCVLEVDDLTESYQCRLALQQGWNELELFVQIPVEVETLRETAGSGVSSGQILLYFQPEVFSAAGKVELGVTELWAYQEPWKRVSEFDLRYNVAPEARQHWAWQFETDGSVKGVLFNHHPANPLPGTPYYDPDGEYFTIDGQNAGRTDALHLKYSVERTDLDQDPRSLYFRAELSRTPEAPNPPILHSYRLLVN